jgi:hypothetical protein
MARDTASVSVETHTVHTLHIDLPLGMLEGVQLQDQVQVCISGTSPKRLTYRDLNLLIENKKNLGY